MQSVKFKSVNNEVQFFEEVKKEVADYFTTHGLRQTGNTEMMVKSVLWVLLWMGSWWSVILFKDNFWLAFSIGLFHMVCHLMIAFNIAHDANHGALSSNARINQLAGYMIEFLGCNRRMWVIGHNQEHHSFVNIYGNDNNIDGYKLLRLCPQEKWLSHHKYQWLYAPFVYGLATLNYATFRDLKMIYRYVTAARIKISWSFMAEFIAFKAFYYLYVFVIPVFVFDVSFSLVLSYFLVGQFVIGLFMVLTFLMPHLIENTSYPLPENGTIQQNWAVHVINTTGDFSADSRVMQWFAGGINLHIAHHLFPRICHVHYHRITPIIKSVSERYGIQYRQMPTFLDALKSHFSLLKTLSRP